MKTIYLMMILFFFISGCSNETHVCTQDLKICQDGSTVARSPPDCEFADCLGDSLEEKKSNESIAQSAYLIEGIVSTSHPIKENSLLEPKKIVILTGTNLNFTYKLKSIAFDFSELEMGINIIGNNESLIKIGGEDYLKSQIKVGEEKIIELSVKAERPGKYLIKSYAIASTTEMDESGREVKHTIKSGNPGEIGIKNNEIYICVGNTLEEADKNCDVKSLDKL